MRAIIGIFINQTEGSAFHRVFHHTRLCRRYEREFDFHKAASDQEILEEVFRIFNDQRPFDYTGPSLSVADVVTLDNDRSYQVLSFGFERLPTAVTGDQLIVELPEPTIAQVKAWRATEDKAKRDSSTDAFYKSLNMCRRCRGKNHLVGYSENSCKSCRGTGEYNPG